MAVVKTPDLGRPQPAPVQQEPIVSAQGLTKKFGGEEAVNDVTFDLPPGSVFGFIGPSGSGKTTTVRLLTGIYAPTSGEARVLGHKPTEFTQGTRARIGYMPQLFVLYPNLTVWENMNFAASIYGMSFGRSKRIHKILDFVELDEHRRKLARDISGGMQRRLSLAATLLHDPDLVFLDEPTAGIDPMLRRKFWDHFKELQKQGHTMFITTQYVNEAAYCDRVGVMAGGRLLVVDTPEGLRHRAFGGEIVHLKTRQPLSEQIMLDLARQPYVQGDITHRSPTQLHIVVDEASTAMPALIEWARQRDVPIEAIEEYLPPFDDVFVQLVEEEQARVEAEGEVQNG